MAGRGAAVTAVAVADVNFFMMVLPMSLALAAAVDDDALLLLLLFFLDELWPRDERYEGLSRVVDLSLLKVVLLKVLMMSTLR